MNRCGSSPLLFATHSLFSIWSDFKSSEKILGAPAWRWGEWIRLPTINKGGEGWLGFPDFWSGEETWWNWSLMCVVNFGEVRRAQLAKSTLLTSTLGPLDLWDLFRSVQMAKREWVAKSNGKQPHLFHPSKTATFVPEFALEDLLLSKSVTLSPAFGVIDLPLDRIFWWWWWLVSHSWVK